MYRLSKIAGMYYHDLTNENYQNSKRGTTVFEGTNSLNSLLDWIVILKRESRKAKYKTVELDLKSMVHIGPAFDTYIVLDNLPTWRRIVNVKKTVNANFLSIYYRVIQKRRKKGLFINTLILDVV